MVLLPAGDGRLANDLAAIVDAKSAAETAAKCAKVGDRVGYVLVLRQGPSLGKNKSGECNEQPFSFHVFLLA